LVVAEVVVMVRLITQQQVAVVLVAQLLFLMFQHLQLQLLALGVPATLLVGHLM
jgi:hypothetical protein